jgi:subtilisin family serine protease
MKKEKKVVFLIVMVVLILLLIGLFLIDKFYFTGKAVSSVVSKSAKDSINPAQKGYIIKLAGPSLIEKQEELKIKYLDKEAVGIAANINKYKNNLAIQHNNIRDEIKNKVKKEISKEYSKTFNGFFIDASEAEIEKIKKISGVIGVYSNYRVEATLMDSVPLINADDVWNIKDSLGNSITGKNITIAIIDTGIDYTQPDLGGCFGVNCKVIGGYDFINYDEDPMDDHGHGTHCAGIAAGSGQGGLKGVAPDAKLYSYKVLNSDGYGYPSDIIAAIEKAVDPNQDGNFNDRVDVISMSLGGGGNPDDPLSIAVDNAFDAGVVSAVAAGNSGPSQGTISSPGTSRKAITVGAADKYDNIAYFSSRGPVIWSNGILIKPDVVAPGVNICSSQYDSAWNNYKCFDEKHVAISGTSMAAPHVAGAVALIKQAHPAWTPEEIKMALRNTAVDLGEDIKTQGYGRINVFGAVSLENVPAIAKIETNGYVKGVINITGTAIGKNFAKYVLYYYYSSDKIAWVEISNSETEVKENILAYNFDTTLLNEGENYFKLEVYGADGKKSEDRSMVFVNNLYISEPYNNEIYRLGENIIIKGDINLEKNFRVEYQNYGQKNPSEWLSNGISLSNRGIGPIDNDTIAIFNTSVLENSGFYKLRIVVLLDNEKEIYEYIENLYLDKSLKQGWPVHIPYYYYSRGSSSNSLVTFSEFYSVAPRKTEERRMSEMASLNESSLLTLKLIKKSKSTISTLSLSEGYYYWAGYLEPVVSDINKDGNKEIIALKGGNPPEVLVYKSDGSLLWKRGFGERDMAGENLHIPLIGDINNDRYDEIFAFNLGDMDYFNYSNLFAFNYKGNIIWNAKVPFDVHPTMLMADLNNDGKKEIVIKGNSAWPEPSISIVSDKGNLIRSWTLPKRRWGGGIEPSPAIGNFDEDSDFEIVSVSPTEKAGYDYENEKWINDAAIYIYNMDGTIVDGWPVYVNGSISSSPVVGDINNDGKQEIVVGFTYASDIFPDYDNGGLYAFYRNGTLLNGWPVEKGWNFWSTPALADVDGDKDLEIVASKLGFVTYILHHDGTIASGWPRFTGWNDYYSPVVGSLNGVRLNVLTSAGDGFYPSIYDHSGVYAWNSTSLVKDFPKVTDFDVQAPVVIDDIDQDRKVEIVASSDWDLDISAWKDKYRGSIYVWDLEGKYDSSKMPWPTFMHDNQHTGCYDCFKISNILKNYTLTVKINGTGTVTSNIGGIVCKIGAGKNCSSSFNKGTKLYLNATPAIGWTFNSWKNCDSGNTRNPCSLNITSNKTVIAYFKKLVKGGQ